MQAVVEPTTSLKVVRTGGGAPEAADGFVSTAIAATRVGSSLVSTIRAGAAALCCAVSMFGVQAVEAATTIYNQLTPDGVGVVSDPVPMSGVNFASSPSTYVAGPRIVVSAGSVVDQVSFDALYGSYGSTSTITGLGQLDGLSLYFFPILEGGAVSTTPTLGFSVPTSNISFTSVNTGHTSTSEGGATYSLVTLSNLSSLLGNTTFSNLNSWEGVMGIHSNSDPLLLGGVSGSGPGSLYARDDLSDAFVQGSQYGSGYHSFRGSVTESLSIPEPGKASLLILGISGLIMRRRRESI